MSKLTPAQSFRFGYISGCIDAGLSPAEAQRGAELLAAGHTKAANDGIMAPVTNAIGAAAALPSRALGWAANYAAPAMLLPPALMAAGYALGNVGGSTLRRSEVAEPIDVNDVQQQELVQSYDWHTAKILSEIKRKRKEQQLKGMQFEGMSK